MQIDRTCTSENHDQAFVEAPQYDLELSEWHQPNLALYQSRFESPQRLQDPLGLCIRL